MFVIKSDKTLFVDCDDTLIIWDKNSSNWHPHKEHIELIKRFHARNQPVIIWSAGGYEWALEVVRLLDLERYVTAVMAKPGWYVDDLKAKDILPDTIRIFLKEENKYKT